MLVLSRKRGERIVIGNDVELVVVEVQGDRVKLGFRAPSDVAIHREEVYQQIREEQGKSNERTVPSRSRRSIVVA